jgi:hypothetical protein
LYFDFELNLKQFYLFVIEMNLCYNISDCSLINNETAIASIDVNTDASEDDVAQNPDVSENGVKQMADRLLVG